MNRAPHPYTLRQLQYAVAVADTLSFRRAAEQCRVAQPSLSAQLAQLEAALGVRLFERDRRGVLLTEPGAALLARARKLLVDADELASAAAVAGDPLASTLRFGVIPTVAPYLLPVIAPALRVQFEKLSVQWTEDKTEPLVRALHEGALDAVLLALEAPLGPVAHGPVWVDPFVLAARAGEAIGRTRAPLDRSALRDVPVLLLDDGHCLREQALSYCARARVREREFRATSLATLAQMVASGEGVTLLPSIAIDAEVARAGLAVRRFCAPEPSRTIVLAWRERTAIGPALAKVARAMHAAASRAFGAPRARSVKRRSRRTDPRSPRT